MEQELNLLPFVIEAIAQKKKIWSDIDDLIYEYIKDKYKLTDDTQANRNILENSGFIIGDKIYGRYRKGRFITVKDIIDDDNIQYGIVSHRVNTHEHGISLLHSIDLIKRAISVTSDNTRAILKRLFERSTRCKNKILKLSRHEWYAFVINNANKLKDDFKEVTEQIPQQPSFLPNINPKTATFTIPEEGKYYYDPMVEDVEEYLSNAYYNYTTQMTVEGIRSKSERLFENYCEQHADIEWIYKNGDTGQEYMSIVYLDGINNQWLFYPDYIVKKKNDEVWIIETKGGELQGQSKNIDRQTQNKFLAFKEYAEKNNIKWGFVRDVNDRLKINNTEYHEDLSHRSWRPLEELL